jgi:uncharacterized protein (TIGR03083 family)
MVEWEAAPVASSVSEARLKELIAAERQAMAAVLNGLPEQSWNAPTLCDGWRVREVVAHMEMLYQYSPVRFLAELARSHGRFNRMADRCARRDGSAAPAELVAVMAAHAMPARAPVGVGFEGALIHDVIHGLDVTVPLGLDRRLPEDTLRAVLDGVVKPRSLKAFKPSLDGVKLHADDLDWSYGSGTPVCGAGQDLALVICGRKVPAGRLRGEASARFTES